MCQSDQTIAFVYILGTTESFYGDTSSCDIHMTSLAQLLQLRGGLEALGMHGLLAKMIVWLDFNHSKLHGTKVCLDQSTVVGRRLSPFTHPCLA